MELQLLSQSLWRSQRLVILCLLLGLASGLVGWVLLPSAYRASAVLVIDSTAVTAPGQEPFIGDPERYITRELETLRSFTVAVGAAEMLDPAPRPQELLDALDFDHVTGSDVVAVTASAESPGRAQDWANAVVSTYIRTRQDAMEEAIGEDLRALEAQMQRLADQLRESDLPPQAISSLSAQYAQANALAVDLLRPGVVRDATRVVDEARDATLARPVDLAPSVIGGGLLGALVGVAAAVAGAVKRPRVASADAVEALSGGPVSAEFAHVRRSSRMSVAQFYDKVAGPAARLETLVSGPAEAERPLVIALCSADGPAGCSTVFSALTLQLADGRRRVAAITLGAEVDVLVRPKGNATRHGTAGGKQRQRSRSVRRALTGPPRREDASAITGDSAAAWQSLVGSVPGLTVASRSRSGKVSVEELERVIAEQAATADVVVIDAGSVLSSPSGRAAVRRADQVIVVVPLGEQLESDLRLALQVIETSSNSPMHVVLAHL